MTNPAPSDPGFIAIDRGQKGRTSIRLSEIETFELSGRGDLVIVTRSGSKAVIPKPHSKLAHSALVEGFASTTLVVAASPLPKKDDEDEQLDEPVSEEPISPRAARAAARAGQAVRR